MLGREEPRPRLQFLHPKLTLMKPPPPEGSEGSEGS